MRTKVKSNSKTKTNFIAKLQQLTHDISFDITELSNNAEVYVNWTAIFFVLAF